MMPKVDLIHECAFENPYRLQMSPNSPLMPDVQLIPDRTGEIHLGWRRLGVRDAARIGLLEGPAHC